jgi:multiple antibiotic resistance protein
MLVDWGTALATANNAFLLAFPSLFSIINPLGMAFVFDGVTSSFSRPQREMIAGRVGVYSFIVMFVSLWAGAYVLNFFGVSLSALRMAGGIVVTLSGWRLLIAEPGRAHSQEKEVPADRAEADPEQLAFFPLTLPFTTGPGTIAVAITLGADRPAAGAGLAIFFTGCTLAALANALIVWVTYRYADRVSDFVGATGRLVVGRLSAFLLMCIGVQILLSTTGDVLTKWRVI